MAVERVAHWAYEWDEIVGLTSGGIPVSDIIITSLPPPGKCKIVNIYYDPSTGKMVVEYDDEPQS